MDKRVQRKKISDTIEAEVLFMSDRLCCIDQKRGDHIHHIDGNNSNNEIDNLALLCFDCHNEASITGNLRKKLTPKTIKKYREFHYEKIRIKRNNLVEELNRNIKSVTWNDLVNSSLSAITLFELNKIRREYYDSILLDRDNILQKISRLSEFNNSRTTLGLFEFLIRVAHETRSDFPLKMVQTIFRLIVDFYPPNDILKNKKEMAQIAFQGINVGSIMIYNSLIHTNKHEISLHGFLIIKYIYRQAVKFKLGDTIHEVENVLKELKSQLNRPERDDLGPAKELLELFHNDLHDTSITLLNLPLKLKVEFLSLEMST